jgi:uncharacterized membrane protein
VIRPTAEGSIGTLAAIAVIRTASNYFLSREMRSEERDGDPDRPRPA